MAASMVTKLGAFPVTQQIVGAFEFSTAFVSIIKNIVKIANCAFKKVNTFANEEKMNKKIGKAADDLKYNAHSLLHGFFTMIPVVGSIMNGIQWNKATYNQTNERDEYQDLGAPKCPKFDPNKTY